MEVFSQLLVINDVRNLILHHPLSRVITNQDRHRVTRFISNFDRALTEQRKKTMPISEGILKNMHHDLITIGSFLWGCFISGNDRGGFPRDPWLYQPAPKPKKE
jgi:hypothetical protein